MASIGGGREQRGRLLQLVAVLSCLFGGYNEGDEAGQGFGCLQELVLRREHKQ